MSEIVLITPPDRFYDFNHLHMLLVNTTKDEQQEIQNFLKTYDENITVYLYNNHNDLPWLFEVAKEADEIYFNIDNTVDGLYYYMSYFVSLPKVTYKHFPRNYDLINKNRVNDINEYLQKYWLA